MSRLLRSLKDKIGLIELFCWRGFENASSIIIVFPQVPHHTYLFIAVLVR